MEKEKTIWFMENEENETKKGQKEANEMIRCRDRKFEAYYSHTDRTSQYS